MIVVKYIPNIVSEKGRTSVQLPFVVGKTVKTYLEEAKVCYIGNRIVTSFSKEALTDINITVGDEEEIIVTTEIKGPIAGIIAAIWSVIVAHPFIAAAVVLSIGFSIYQAVTFRKASTPSFGKISEDLDAGPSSAWDGMQTTQDVGLPIAVAYGRVGVPGNRLCEYIWTDGDKNYLNTLLGLSVGEIDGIEALYINDNPAENFDGITAEYRYGTNDQTVLANFQDLHDINSVASKLTKDNPYIYTTTLTDMEAFELYFTLTGGLYEQDSADGSMLSWQQTILVEYKLHSASNYITAGTLTIDGKSRTALRRIYRKEGLVAGQYDIRVTKTSDDSSTYKIGDVEFTNVDEIRTDDIAYINTALASVRSLATEQLSGTSPNFRVEIRGVKVSIPKILTAAGGNEVDWEDYYWDSDTSQWKLLLNGTVLYWDGTTYTTKWSANPIWCLRDLITNGLYGLGDYISTADIDDIINLEMAKYCEERVSDGIGGYEKRFRLDVVIDSLGKALDTIAQLCTSFRGVVLSSAGSIKVKIEKPEDPVQLFGMGNIVTDSYSEAWKSRREAYNIFEVKFMDKEKGYREESIVIMDQAAIAAGILPRRKTIRIFTTKMSYAVREGEFLKRACKYIDRAVTFKANMTAIACMAFDVISFSHDTPQIGFSGLVKTGSTTTSVNLDRAVTIEGGKSYRLVIYFAGDTSEEKIVTNAAGSTSAITVSVPFTNAPAKFDRYTFGEVGKTKKDYRIISLRREPNREVSITALEYVEEIYADGEMPIPSDNYSVLSLDAAPITNLVLTEGLVKLKDGSIEDVIDVWFRKPSLVGKFVGGFSKARIYLSDNAGVSWRCCGETTDAHFQIIGGIIDLTEYTVAVTSVSSFGQEKAVVDSPSAIISVVGKSAPPSDVTTFLVNQDRDRLKFGWTTVSDVDIWGYEIRRGGDWISGEVLAFVQGNSYETTDMREGIDQSYWIKAIDTSGNYSNAGKEAVVTIDNIPYKNVITTYSEHSAWAGDKSKYEILVARVTVYYTAASAALVCRVSSYVTHRNLVCRIDAFTGNGKKGLTNRITVRNNSSNNLICRVTKVAA